MSDLKDYMYLNTLPYGGDYDPDTELFSENLY